MNPLHIASLLAFANGSGPEVAAPELPRVSAHYHDVTDDGVPDKLAVDQAGNLCVLVNSGGRRFELVAQRFPSVVPTDFLVDDLDGDGVTDIYVVAAGANVALRGLGGGRFEDATGQLGLADGGHGLGAQRVDLDGNGRAEILLENQDGQVVFWAEPDGTYRRDGPEPALPPSTNASIALVVPAGTIVPFAGRTPPAGYFMCDGSEVSRLMYPELFRVCGVTYGPGNMMTTFNLPDLRLRLPLGKADSAPGAVLGQTGGAFDHAHAAPAHAHDVPAHTHSLADHTHTGPSHDHGMSHVHSVAGHLHGPGNLSTGADGGHNHDVTGLTVTGDGSHAHTASSSVEVPDGSVGIRFVTRQVDSTQGSARRMLGFPTTGVDIQYFGADGQATIVGTAHSHSITVGGAGTHSHDVGGSVGAEPDHTHALSGNVGNTSGPDGDSGFNTSASSASLTGLGGNLATSTPNTNTSGQSTVFATTTASGGDTSAANPPYIVLNYIIKY